MKIAKPITIFFLLFLVILVIVWAIQNLFTLAYFSFVDDCFPKEVSEREIPPQFVTAGRVSFERIDNQTIIRNISIFIRSKEVIKHEVCHVDQANEDRLDFCETVLGSYGNELECYFADELPDFIYGRFYNLTLVEELLKN